ncbi:hypothetical protein Tco_0312130 [Tanacetum coccineum]
MILRDDNKSSKWQPNPILDPVIKSSSSSTLTSLEESDLIWEEFEAYLANLDNDLVDIIPEMFTNEHALDYSSPPRYDDVDVESSDALPSTITRTTVFNPGILIHENLFEVTIRATPYKNVKKTTNVSLILEDFNPPLYELSFHKEVPGSEILLSFSSENKEKVFNLGILNFTKELHSSLLSEFSHRGLSFQKS